MHGTGGVQTLSLRSKPAVEFPEPFGLPEVEGGIFASVGHVLRCASILWPCHTMIAFGREYECFDRVRGSNCDQVGDFVVDIAG